MIGRTHSLRWARRLIKIGFRARISLKATGKDSTTIAACEGIASNDEEVKDLMITAMSRGAWRTIIGFVTTWLRIET